MTLKDMTREERVEQEVKILRYQVNALITVCNELKACIENLTIIVERLDDKHEGLDTDGFN